MKKALLVLSTLVTLYSCQKPGCTNENAINYNERAQKDDGSCRFESTNTNNVVSGFITSNTTWTSDNIYELNGKVIVDNGATLTIEAGTIIKGQEGTGANASALIIARGSKINAVGTPLNPIIFTTVLDNIEMGQYQGTNLDETDDGKWGGLVILGDAPISAGDGDTETQIEGIPATATYGTFGGHNLTDNSGILSYVSIRHGGALIGAGNEINGLTLGGVGSGTVINNIEVIATLDDGVECFGGTVDIDNLVVGYQGDDAIDIDMNYQGNITNFYLIQGNDTDEAFEIDGPEGSTYIDGSFTLINGIVKNYNGSGTGMDLKSKPQGTISNVSFEGYDYKIIKLRSTFSDTLNCIEKTDAYSNLVDSKLNLENIELITTNTFSQIVNVYNGTVINSQNDICTQNQHSNVETILTNNSVNISNNSTVELNVNNFGWTWIFLNNKN